ncbi:hypothetical protein L0P02_14120, partial [Bifidobacterium longum]|nr:hypothetical protein [Bifidobacterium longum]
ERIETLQKAAVFSQIGQGGIDQHEYTGKVHKDRDQHMRAMMPDYVGQPLEKAINLLAEMVYKQ